MTKQVAIITGDIINSRQVHTEIWQNKLTSVLSYYGTSPNDWEIFRGDSFQLKCNVEHAIRAVIHIKSYMRQISSLDVRMGIGIGEIQEPQKSISNSTGTAFVRSGNSFDQLKKKTLAIQTGKESLDTIVQTYLDLASTIMSDWKKVTSAVMQISIENPTLKQHEIAHKYGYVQSSISRAQKRGGYDELMKMEEVITTLIQKQLTL